MHDNDLLTLQKQLDELPAGFEPLDASAIDGYLAGVLLQPRAVATDDWWPGVVDPDGRAADGSLRVPAALALQATVVRRRDVLDQALRSRSWFDPWIFELEDEGAGVSECVVPWVSGFALAMERYPALMDDFDPQHTLEPLALLYVHFDTEDLEDADELIDAIAGIEPASTLSDAVEDLVSAVLLLADVTRPLPAARPVSARKPRRRR